VSWQDDLPSIPTERIRDAVMDEGARRVHRRRLVVGGSLSLAIVLLAGLAAVSMRRDNQTHVSTRPVATTAPQPLAVDAQGSSSISGAVTVGGTPLAGATVTVSSDPCCVNRYAYTGADGRYAVHDLPAAKYTVGFTKGGARSSWYDNKPTATDATPVTLAEGETRTGIDGMLIAGASISGRVTSQTGAPLAGIWVYFNGTSDYGKVETGADGTYVINDVPPGDYTIQFDPGPPHLPYIPEYYNDKTATADHLHLVDGQHVTGIDGVLASA